MLPEEVSACVSAAIVVSRSDQIKSVWASPSPRASTCGMGIIHTLLDAGRFWTIRPELSANRAPRTRRMHGISTNDEGWIGNGGRWCRMWILWNYSTYTVVFAVKFAHVVYTDSLVRCLLRYILGSKFCGILFFCRYEWKWVKMQLIFGAMKFIWYITGIQSQQKVVSRKGEYLQVTDLIVRIYPVFLNPPNMASWVCSAEYGTLNLVRIGMINEWNENNYII